MERLKYAKKPLSVLHILRRGHFYYLDIFVQRNQTGSHSGIRICLYHHSYRLLHLGRAWSHMEIFELKGKCAVIVLLRFLLV